MKAILTALIGGIIGGAVVVALTRKRQPVRKERTIAQVIPTYAHPLPAGDVEKLEHLKDLVDEGVQPDLTALEAEKVKRYLNGMITQIIIYISGNDGDKIASDYYEG